MPNPRPYRCVCYTRNQRIVSRRQNTWREANEEFDKIGLPGHIEAHVPGIGWVVDDDGDVIVDTREESEVMW